MRSRRCSDKSDTRYDKSSFLSGIEVGVWVGIWVGVWVGIWVGVWMGGGGGGGNPAEKTWVRLTPLNCDYVELESIFHVVTGLRSEVDAI